MRGAGSVCEAVIINQIDDTVRYSAQCTAGISIAGACIARPDTDVILVREIYQLNTTPKQSKGGSHARELACECAAPIAEGLMRGVREVGASLPRRLAGEAACLTLKEKTTSIRAI